MAAEKGKCLLTSVCRSTLIFFLFAPRLYDLPLFPTRHLADETFLCLSCERKVSFRHRSYNPSALSFLLNAVQYTSPAVSTSSRHLSLLSRGEMSGGGVTAALSMIHVASLGGDFAMLTNVKFEFGKVGGVLTARAKLPLDDKEFVIDYSVADPAEWKTRKGFGKLVFHMMTQVKSILETRTRCRICGKGEITFKKTAYKNVYTIKAKSVDFQEERICRDCYKSLYPLRTEFCPHPEEEEAVTFRGFRNHLQESETGTVVDVQRVRRDLLLEDVEYLAALDYQQSREWLSG